jgi:hypothetical protein
MSTLRFRTLSQAVLFEKELQGQLSDGQWENSRPYDHWKPWCNCEVEYVIGDEPVGRDFYAHRDNYNFVNKDLLEIVGKRMIAYVRLGLKYGRGAVNILESLLDLEGDFRGMPDYKGDFWDRQRKEIEDTLKWANLTMEDVKQVVEDETVYGKKQLLADLKEMKQIVRTWI